MGFGNILFIFVCILLVFIARRWFANKPILTASLLVDVLITVLLVVLIEFLFK